MTTFGRNRRDPLEGENGFSKRKGFTLVELMLVLAVVAIITSFALPSYRTLIEKRQVTSGAEQLGAFLSAVQMESVKRSEDIYVDYYRLDADTWCIGIVNLVGGRTDCDCTKPATDANACLIDSQLRVINDSNLNYPGVMNSIDGDGSFVYDPARGLIHDDMGSTTFDEAELELLSEDGSYALNVQITSTGRVKMCSDSDAKKVPGYDTCTRDIQ